MKELHSRWLRLAAAASFTALLTACGTGTLAPVENRSTGGFSTTGPRIVDPRTLAGWEFNGKPGYYTVQPGDTMYSVARAHGVSGRDVINWNSAWVPEPTQMEVGQVLRIAPPAGATRTATAPRPAATTAAPRPAATTTTADTPSTTTTTPPAASGNMRLAWPTQGRTIVTPYDGVRSKGIGISGREGDPVTAAEAGNVMYAGSNLRGYGNMVILQHANNYLTVYGHNSKLLVKEGQSVKKGQQIAQMGQTEADRVKLHFEVRRANKAYNPFDFLPR